MNQIVVVIYLPLFIDTFGTRKTKATWMSSMLLAPPLGVMVGYGLTAYCVGTHDSWKLSFILQGVIMFFCLVVTLVLPDSVVDIDGVIRAKK